MEIITYILEGELEHRDSLGNGAILRTGEFQRMTAGTGIQHSEANPSQTTTVHLYQIWMLPRQKGLSPSYDQRIFAEHERNGRLRLVASSDGREDSLTVQQNASIYLGNLAAGQEISHRLTPGRHAWIQVMRGSVAVAENGLHAGDGLAISEELSFTIKGQDQSEVMVFDLE